MQPGPGLCSAVVRDAARVVSTFWARRKATSVTSLLNDTTACRAVRQVSGRPAGGMGPVGRKNGRRGWSKTRRRRPSRAVDGRALGGDNPGRRLNPCTHWPIGKHSTHAPPTSLPQCHSRYEGTLPLLLLPALRRLGRDWTSPILKNFFLLLLRRLFDHPQLPNHGTILSYPPRLWRHGHCSAMQVYGALVQPWKLLSVAQLGRLGISNQLVVSFCVPPHLQAQSRDTTETRA